MFSYFLFLINLLLFYYNPPCNLNGNFSNLYHVSSPQSTLSPASSYVNAHHITQWFYQTPYLTDQILDDAIAPTEQCLNTEQVTVSYNRSRSVYYHRLNGSSSPVLTATCLSYGSFCDFLTFFSGTRLGVRRPNRSSRKMAQMTWIRA